MHKVVVVSRGGQIPNNKCVCGGVGGGRESWREGAFVLGGGVCVCGGGGGGITALNFHAVQAE